MKIIYLFFVHLLCTQVCLSKVATKVELNPSWIPVYEAPVLNSKVIRTITSSELKSIEERDIEWGKLENGFVYLPKESTTVPSKDTAGLMSYLFNLNSQAYSCAIEPTRSFDSFEISLDSSSKNWKTAMSALLFSFSYCLNNSQYVGKWYYEPLVRVSRNSDLGYIWVVKSSLFFIYAITEKNFVVSSAFFSEITSDAILASLVFYGKTLASESQKKIDFKELDHAIEKKDWQSALYLAKKYQVVVESLTLPLSLQFKQDIHITDQLIKYHYHPGSWYSFLISAAHLEEKGLSNVMPFRQHLGNIRNRIYSIKRYLDRNNFSVAGKIINKELYVNDLKKANVTPRLLVPTPNEVLIPASGQEKNVLPYNPPENNQPEKTTPASEPTPVVESEKQKQ